MGGGNEFSQVLENAGNRNDSTKICDDLRTNRQQFNEGVDSWVQLNNKLCLSVGGWEALQAVCGGGRGKGRRW